MGLKLVARGIPKERLVAYQLLLWLPLVFAWRSEPWIETLLVMGAMAAGLVGAIRHSLAYARVGEARAGDWMLVALAGPAMIGAGQWAAGWSAVSEETVRQMWRWLGAAGLGWAILADTPESAARRRFREVTMWVGLVVVAWGAVQAVTSKGAVFWLIPTEQEWVFGPFLNRNQFAVFCELMLPLAWLWARERKQWWIGISPALAGLLTESRAGSAILVAECLVLVALTERRWTKTKGLVAAGAAGTAAAVGGWWWTRTAEPLLYRDAIWAAAADLWRERPWTGHGLGTFEWVYPAYARFDTGEIVNHAHNDWLEWGAEGGIGMVMVMALLGVSAVRRLRVAPWMLGTLAALGHGLVDFPLQKYPVLLIWVVLVALGSRERTGFEGGRRRVAVPAKEPAESPA